MTHGIDTKYGEVTTENKEFHENEPIFILRGQDPLAVDAIAAYRRTCELQSVEESHLEAIDTAIEAFDSWQADNPNLVKELPDS